MSGHRQATVVDDEDDDDDDEFMLTPRTRDRFGGQGYSQHPKYRPERPNYPVHRPSRPQQRTDVGQYRQQRRGGSRFPTKQPHNYNSQRPNDFNSQRSHEYNTQRSNDYNSQRSNDYNSQRSNDFSSQRSNDFNSQRSNDYNSQRTNDYNSQRSRGSRYKYTDHRGNYNKHRDRSYENQSRSYENQSRSYDNQSRSNDTRSRSFETQSRSYNTQPSQDNPRSRNRQHSKDGRYPYDRHYPHDTYNQQNIQHPQSSSYSQYGSNERHGQNQKRDYGPLQSDRSHSTSLSPFSKGSQVTGKDKIIAEVNVSPVFPKAETSNEKSSPKREALNDKVSPKVETAHDSKAGFKKSVSELLTEKENRSAKKIRKRLSSEKQEHDQGKVSKQETDRSHQDDTEKLSKSDTEKGTKSVRGTPYKVETAPNETNKDRHRSGKETGAVTTGTQEKEKPCDKNTENIRNHKKDGSNDSKKMVQGKSAVKSLTFEAKSKEIAETCVKENQIKEIAEKCIKDNQNKQTAEKHIINNQSKELTEKNDKDKHKQSSSSSNHSSREQESKHVDRREVETTKVGQNSIVVNNSAQKSKKDEDRNTVSRNERKDEPCRKVVISGENSKSQKSSTESRSEKKKDRNQSGEKHPIHNVTKSRPKIFVDSSGGYRVKPQKQSSSVDKAESIVTEKEHSKVLKKHSVEKDKTFHPTLNRQISNSSSTSVESAKTNSSSTGSNKPGSRSERKTSSEISTFDFAGDIFQDCVSKHETKKSKSDKCPTASKTVPETPAEQLKEKSHKQKQKKDDDSRNKQDDHKQKKLEVLGSDTSGTDAEFEHFKNILTQVHDSRWKTKPLKSDSRRSSTQSHKSTDSSASVSLLNPQKALKVLSKKAYRKFGVRNVEYREKKMYYKGIKIKQPVVYIREKDIQKVIKYKKKMKFRRKQEKAQKSKFKRICRLGSSSPESDKAESDRMSMSVVEESDTGLSSTSDQVVREKIDKNQEFGWIVPDSFEETDISQLSSDQRKKTHKHETHRKNRVTPEKEEHTEKETHAQSKDKHHREHKKIVSPSKKKNSSSDMRSRKKEERGGTKGKSETESKTENVSVSKRKTTKTDTDSDFNTKTSEQEITCISSVSSTEKSQSDVELKGSIHSGHGEKKEIQHQKTKLSSSPKFRQSRQKPKSVPKTLQKHQDSSSSTSSDSELENIQKEISMDNQTIENDINKSAFVQETDSSHSSSDILAKNDGIHNHLKLSPVVKPCEIALTKVEDKKETRNVYEKSTNRETTELTVKDVTEIPETQMSPVSTSSSDLPIFKISSEDSDKDITVIAKDESFHKQKIIDRKIKVEMDGEEHNNSDISTQETQSYSCGNPVLKETRNTSETNHNENNTVDSVMKDADVDKSENKIEDKTDENARSNDRSENGLEEYNSKQGQVVSGASDKEPTDTAKSSPLKTCLSPQDKLKIKQGFKAFQTKLMKYQQRQRKERKLKSKIITKKLKDRGLLSEKDETGNDGDVEDNLLVESLSDSDDSDVEILNKNKNYNVRKEVSKLNLGSKETEKLDVLKNVSPSLDIQSMSENENSDMSVSCKSTKDNNAKDTVTGESMSKDSREDNRALSDTSDKLVLNKPLEVKRLSNRISNRSPDGSQNLNIQSMSENENSDASVINEQREGTSTLSENSDRAVLSNAKEQITKPLPVSSEQQIDKITGQVQPELNKNETNIDGIDIKVEQDDEKDDGVRYESFTSSCSQCSSSSDETERENVTIVSPKELKTEKEEMDISNIDGYRHMSLHGKEIEIDQYLKKGSNEGDTNKSEQNEDVKPSLANLINNENPGIKQEIATVEPELSTNIGFDHVKEEPVQVKEEPDWSKFSYTQEPDAIFVSDSDDNEIMSAQNETIQVNSDSDNDVTVTNSQSAYDSQVLDPEFWDFSSPEICSSDEDIKPVITPKANETVKMSPLASTSKIEVKHEKNDTVEKSKVVKDEEFNVEIDNEKTTDASESVEGSYSGSELSCDESEYVEIGSSDSEKEQDSTLKVVEILDDSSSSAQTVTPERQCNTSVSESYKAATMIDSFDPYSVATQIGEDLPSSSRAKAISEATKRKSKPHLKYLNESSSENESPFPQRSAKNSEETKIRVGYNDLYEAYTQVDRPDPQRINTDQEPEIQEKGEINQKVPDDIELDDYYSDSLSDSSLVDAADCQVKLYEQSRKYPHKTKIVSAAGLIIRCDKNEFGSKQGMHKIKKISQSESRALETPVNNEEFVDVDWYSTMTQIDTPNNIKESTANSVQSKENKKEPIVDEFAAYGALTQVDNESFVSSEDEIVKVDDHKPKGKTVDDECIAYGALTQVDKEAYGLSHDDESDKNDEIDLYADMTQIDIGGSSKVPDMEKVNETEDGYYAALTQKDTDILSGESDTGEYNPSKKKVDINVSKKAKDYENQTRHLYNMETQVDSQSEGITDISIISLTDSDQCDAKKVVEKDGEKTDSVPKGKTHLNTSKTADAVKVSDGDKRIAIQGSSSKEKDNVNKLNSIKEKLKLSLSKKRTIEIPIQKTNSWRMARQLSNSSSIVTTTSKRNDSSGDNTSEPVSNHTPTAAPKQTSIVNKPLDDIEFYNAKKSDMWLSKNSSRSLKSPPNPPGKRKRRATSEAEKGSSLSSAAIQEARKRLADRNLQTVMHPELKADTLKKPKLDRPTELEDVDLPSCSQIVSKGLPILNQTGLLVKKNKPQHQTSSRFASRAGSLAETMMETALESAPKHQTTETGPGSSAFELVERELGNLKPQGPDRSEKDKLGENVEDSGIQQRKRRLSNVSQKSEYMPDTKTSKKQSSNDITPSASEKKSATEQRTSKGSMPQTSKKQGASGKSSSRSDSCAPEKQRGDRKSSKEDSKSTDSAKPKADRNVKSNSSVSEKTGAHKPRTDRKSSREENPKPSDTAKRKGSDRDKTINKAAKMTDITNVPKEKSPEPKSKPVWNASSVEKQPQKKPESKGAGAEKAKKKVGFGENIKFPTASTSTGPNTSRGPNTSKGLSTSQKVTTKQNENDQVLKKQAIVDRPNLMLKTSVQTSDGSRAAHEAGAQHPLSRLLPAQPIQRQNQGPVPVPMRLTNQGLPPGTALANQEKGISFKEFLAVMLRWNPVWFEEHGQYQDSALMAEREDKMSHDARKKGFRPGLTQTANLMEKDHDSQPPNCINGLPGEPTLLPLVEKYSSFKEYSNNFMIPLLLYETWESCFQTWREKRGRNNLAKHSMCLGAVQDAGDKLNDFVLLGLLTEGQKKQNQFFTEGDLMILKISGTILGDNNRTGERKEQTMLGLVEKVFLRDTNIDQLCRHNIEFAKRRRPDSFSVKVILKTRKRKFSPDYNKLGELMQVGSVVTTLRQFRAMECLPNNPLCRDILWPTNNDTYCDESARIKTQSTFNLSQQKAIMTAAQMVSRPSHKPRICLLQGPPGTGKSHTILGIINQILEEKQHKARICLCAPSHAAIDELLRRLARQNKQLKEKDLASIKLLRVGKPSSVHQDVRHLCLENLVDKNVKNELMSEKLKQLPQSLLRERTTLDEKISAVEREIKNSPDLKKKKLSIDLKELRKQRDILYKKCQVDMSKEKASSETLWKVKTNLIEKANIIAGTLSGIGSSALKQYFESAKEKGRQVFDCIIIDEATQAIELDTLIPLQYGTTKMILVGDPEQLSPTVVSQVAVENRFNLSLFERLNSHFRYSHYNPVIMLDTQYRMDPEICSFPSNYIYDGKLKTDRSIYGRSQCPLEPYLLYDIADGREQLSQCSGSVSNPAEAMFTVSLVEFIVENTNVTANVIGIIAPYQKQKSLLVAHLKDSSLNALAENVEVSTVDGFQGREKHVIIMSCVRAKSSTGTIGFVGNRSRMNVALTRAKYALYVIAHFDSLQRSDEWKPLIEDANARDKRIQVTERNVSFALAKCLKRSHRPP